MTVDIHFLLVDDDEVDVMTVRRALAGNTTLHVASEGAEALRMLRSGQIDLRGLIVLLDLNMPGMNGLEMLHELRADPTLRGLPVVVLTTSDEERDKVQAYRFNVAGYVVKPMTSTRFRSALDVVRRYWSLAELPTTWSSS